MRSCLPAALDRRVRISGSIPTMLICPHGDATLAIEQAAIVLCARRFSRFHLLVRQRRDEQQSSGPVQGKLTDPRLVRRSSAPVEAGTLLSLPLTHAACLPTNLAIAAWKHNRRGYSLRSPHELLRCLPRRNQTRARSGKC